MGKVIICFVLRLESLDYLEWVSVFRGVIFGGRPLNIGETVYLVEIGSRLIKNDSSPVVRSWWMS